MKIREVITELSFHGRTCTKDCSGHKAGWDWARKHQTTQASTTPSTSFNNGTEIAISQRKAGKEPIGATIRGAKGRFQKFQPQMEDIDVDEMIGVKKYHGLTLDELMNQIANDYDLRVLGQGAFGHVLSTNDPNIVVKVFETDDAYMSFVDYVQQNPNKHYPKIVKSPRLMTTFYKRYDLQPDKFTVLSLERLVPLSDNMAQFVADVANARDLHDKPFKLPNGRMNGGDYNYDDDYIDPGVTFRELSRDYPWIPNFWEAVRQLFRSGIVKGNIDMHPGNFMARQDGTIVIIDPVADPKALERKRTIYDLKWGHGKKPNVQGPHYRLQRTQDQNNEI